ncbi:MAG TPA: aminotransferase class V-fold PLP-dependent enzyme, partial [Puia sp.]|nr:aminotransferase class V-fold PLP-dependent enzyme [Puia sp.]
GEIICKYDALYLLDACQSVGQMEIDAVASHADFISGTFRKFLRGPRGAGLLYVSDKALRAGLEPLYIDLRGAQWIAAGEYRPLADAKRFEDWETAYALMAGSSKALNYALSLGIDNIEARNNELVLYLRNQLSAAPFIKLQDKGRKKCSIVTFSMEGQDAESAIAYFRDQGINIYFISKSSALIDFLEKGIDWVFRVSPHYYNTTTEIDRFMEALKKLAETKPLKTA